MGPDGPHVGPMNLAIRDGSAETRTLRSNHSHCFMWDVITRLWANLNGSFTEPPFTLGHG